ALCALERPAPWRFAKAAQIVLDVQHINDVEQTAARLGNDRSAIPGIAPRRSVDRHPGSGRGRHELLHPARWREGDRLAWSDIGYARPGDELRGAAGHHAIGRRPPEDGHVDRHVRSIETGPGRPRLKVLIDTPVILSGQRHAFRAPLPKSHAVAPAVAAETDRSRGCRRRTTGPIGCAGPAEGRLRRLGLISVER